MSHFFQMRGPNLTGASGAAISVWLHIELSYTQPPPLVPALETFSSRATPISGGTKDQRGAKIGETAMAGPITSGHLLSFLEKHGYIVLFLWVLAEQGAVPVPSIPLLLAAGALIRSNRLDPLSAVLCCVVASFIADTFWFEIGKRRGRRMLQLVCRISLEPGSCVQQADNLFRKYGMKALLVSKFIPGLNAVAAPLAGSSKRSWRQYVLFEITGSVLWSGSYILLGYLFSAQLEEIDGHLARMGIGLVSLVAGCAALWLGWKVVQRERFLRQLDVARITPAELAEMIDAGKGPFIVDLRHPAEDQPDFIPGAVRLSFEDLEVEYRNIPLDRDVILACDCPNEAASAQAAMLLRSKGITRVRPLQGGIDAWAAYLTAHAG
jgi:membrane protein DedA with SNARE-associated domain/rhodanese-related sulfurtransferase